MLNLVRFLRILTLVFVGVFGALHIAPAVACTADEISINNGATCVPSQFEMRVCNFPSNGDDFTFYVSALGTLYIDWGDGYTETKTLGNKHLNTRMDISRKFYDNQECYTIRLSGNFTQYPKKDTNYANAVISVYGGYATPEYLYGISGSLGALFPTLNNGTSATDQPLFYSAFHGATNLRGPIPATLFDGIHGNARTRMFNEMFYGCTNLDEYIPYNLFDGINNISTSNMTDIFKNDTKLATTCPPGTTQVTTGYENYWKPGTSGTAATPRVACKPDAVACDHAYNGVCPDLCSFATQLKTSTGLSFPLFANKVTSVAINIRQNGVTCYVPLEAGNGGTGSLNLTYNNTTYHAGVLDN